MNIFSFGHFYKWTKVLVEHFRTSDFLYCVGTLQGASLTNTTPAKLDKNVQKEAAGSDVTACQLGTNYRRRAESQQKRLLLPQ